MASVPFEQFHKYSTDIVRTAVFGKDKEGKLKSVLKFPANNLVSVPGSHLSALKLFYTM